MRYSMQSLRWLLVTPLVLFSTIAYAGRPGKLPITVILEPTSASIPTFGQTAVLITILLMAVIGIRFLRNKPGAGRALGVFLLATVGTAGLLVSEPAPAPEPADIMFEGAVCGGGEETYFGTPDIFNGKNGCNNALRVADYIYDDSAPACFMIVDSCPIGTVLNSGASCPLNHYVCENEP